MRLGVAWKIPGSFLASRPGSLLASVEAPEPERLDAERDLIARPGKQVSFPLAGGSLLQPTTRDCRRAPAGVRPATPSYRRMVLASTARHETRARRTGGAGRRLCRLVRLPLSTETAGSGTDREH